MTSFLMVGCNGILDSESERNTFDEDFQMSTPHDSLYALVGVMSKLQKLGDRYVLLGELRGDLMQTTDDASLYLKEINDFNISNDNPYASTKEYYAVINNCNYIIKYVDTTLLVKDDKPMYRVMAAAKSIRAWTYLQLVLNYGSAKYIVDPIISAEDAQKTYEEYDLSRLAAVLIEDLLPFKDVNTLSLGFFGSFNSKLSIFPIKFLLGDLYLWRGEYENAAKSYYDLMYDEELIINKPYSSYWEFPNNVPAGGFLFWHYSFAAGSVEVISTLASSPDYGSPFTLDSLSYHYNIAPTTIAINNWLTPLYFYSEIATTDGDMRGMGSYYSENVRFSNIEYTGDPYIIKYTIMETDVEKRIVIYRNSLLYLRYAEAVNRLGYPRMAFAAIKYGLNDVTHRKPFIAAEVGSIASGKIPSYMNFTDFRFRENVGTRMRGLGNTNLDTTYYIMKKFATKADSVEFVEDKIMEELAAEMAFEGNRFHDLMRVALRRNKPAYLADKVSAKYTTNKDAIRGKLMDINEWYLPK